MCSADASDARKRGNTSYVNWRDEQGIVRRHSTRCLDKAEAVRIKRQIQKDQQRDHDNLLAKWRKVLLSQHAKDYRNYQLSVGTTKKQVDQIHSRITRIVEAAKVRHPVDLTVSRVTTTIDALRMVHQSPNRKPETYPPLSLRTKNFYAKAIKQLTAWMVREKRLEHDPLLHVPMRKMDTDNEPTRNYIARPHNKRRATGLDRSTIQLGRGLGVEIDCHYYSAVTKSARRTRTDQR